MNNIDGLLGLATAARKVSIGDTLLEDVRRKQCKLVVIASDAAENTKKKIIDKCTYYAVDYVMIDTSEQLSRVIGKVNVKAVAILDQGFAKAIKNKMKG